MIKSIECAYCFKRLGYWRPKIVSRKAYELCRCPEVFEKTIRHSSQCIYCGNFNYFDMPEYQIDEPPPTPPKRIDAAEGKET